MAFFSLEHTKVCIVCRVHFEEDPEYTRWNHLCSSHRKPAMTEDLLMDAIKNWSLNNWQHVVRMAIEKGDTGIQELFDNWQQSGHTEELHTIILADANRPKLLE